MFEIMGNRDEASRLSVALTSAFSVEVRDCIDSSYMDDLYKQECEV